MYLEIFRLNYEGVWHSFIYCRALITNTQHYEHELEKKDSSESVEPLDSRVRHASLKDLWLKSFTWIWYSKLLLIIKSIDVLESKLCIVKQQRDNKPRIEVWISSIEKSSSIVRQLRQLNMPMKMKINKQSFEYCVKKSTLFILFPRIL